MNHSISNSRHRNWSCLSLCWLSKYKYINVPYLHVCNRGSLVILDNLWMHSPHHHVDRGLCIGGGWETNILATDWIIGGGNALIWAHLDPIQSALIGNHPSDFAPSKSHLCERWCWSLCSAEILTLDESLWWVSWWHHKLQFPLLTNPLARHPPAAITQSGFSAGAPPLLCINTYIEPAPYL